MLSSKLHLHVRIILNKIFENVNLEKQIFSKVHLGREG